MVRRRRRGLSDAERIGQGEDLFGGAAESVDRIERRRSGKPSVEGGRQGRTADPLAPDRRRLGHTLHDLNEHRVHASHFAEGVGPVGIPGEQREGDVGERLQIRRPVHALAGDLLRGHVQR